jgi:hypothetical protein
MFQWPYPRFRSIFKDDLWIKLMALDRIRQQPFFGHTKDKAGDKIRIVCLPIINNVGFVPVQESDVSGFLCGAIGRTVGFSDNSPEGN